MTHLLLLLFLLPGQTPNQAEKWRQNWLKVSENPQTKRPLAPTWHGETREEPGKSGSTKPVDADGVKPVAADGVKPVAADAQKRPQVTGTAQPVTPRPGDGKLPAPPAGNWEKMTALQLIQVVGWATDVKGQFTAADLDGPACLKTLTRLRIPWKAGRQKRGLVNPVELTSHLLNGVYYHWYWGESPDMLLDCRMVLALWIAAPVFRKHGFDEVLYTSSYRYTRIGGTRRLSRHASGNALDVKALRGPGGVVAVVERDWHHHRGTLADCVGPLPPGPARKMRELVCEFETLPLFGGILTPDYDFDHRNHFHIGGVLPGEKWFRHRACGRPLTRKRGAGYRYVPTLKYPLPKRPPVLPPWPAGVDPQAPMPTKGALPKPVEPEVPDPPLDDPELAPDDPAVKPDGTPPEAVKPDGTKPDGTKPDETKPDETKPDGGSDPPPDATEDSPPPDEKPAEIEGPPQAPPAAPDTSK
mgnify:CR=1 FL=1